MARLHATLCGSRLPPNSTCHSRQPRCRSGRGRCAGQYLATCVLQRAAAEWEAAAGLQERRGEFCTAGQHTLQVLRRVAPTTQQSLRGASTVPAAALSGSTHRPLELCTRAERQSQRSKGGQRRPRCLVRLGSGRQGSRCRTLRALAAQAPRCASRGWHHLSSDLRLRCTVSPAHHRARAHLRSRGTLPHAKKLRLAIIRCSEYQMAAK